MPTPGSRRPSGPRRSRSRTRRTRRARPTVRRTRPRPAWREARGRTAGRASGGLLVPAGPVPDELDLELQLDAVALADRAADELGEAADVGRCAALVVYDDVRVLLGDHRAADPGALQPELVDEPPRRVAVGVAEHRARRRDPQRLVCLAPVADLVEPALDLDRVGGREPEDGAHDDLGRASGGLRRRVLEPAVPVAEAELVGRQL